MIDKKVGGRKTKCPSEYELNLMYQTMTAKEIGDELGVSETTVRRWIWNYRRKARNAEKTD